MAERHSPENQPLQTQPGVRAQVPGASAGTKGPRRHGAFGYAALISQLRGVGTRAADEQRSFVSHLDLAIDLASL